MDVNGGCCSASAWRITPGARKLRRWGRAKAPRRRDVLSKSGTVYRPDMKTLSVFKSGCAFKKVATSALYSDEKTAVNEVRWRSTTPAMTTPPTSWRGLSPRLRTRKLAKRWSLRSTTLPEYQPMSHSSAFANLSNHPSCGFSLRDRTAQCFRLPCDRNRRNCANAGSSLISTLWYCNGLASAAKSLQVRHTWPRSSRGRNRKMASRSSGANVRWALRVVFAMVEGSRTEPLNLLCFAARKICLSLSSNHTGASG